MNSLSLRSIFTASALVVTTGIATAENITEIKTYHTNGSKLLDFSNRRWTRINADEEDLVSLKPKGCWYQSTISTDGQGALDLTMEANYNDSVSNAPLMVMPHQYSGPSGLFDQVRPNATPTYGWNLENTLEQPSGEGTWRPAASRALINTVADSGFNVVRLPVAWDSHAHKVAETGTFPNLQFPAFASLLKPNKHKK